MKFDNPNILYAFFIPVALILFYIWAARRQRSVRETFAARKLLPELTTFFDSRKCRLKNIFLVIAISLAVLSLMRPKWGFHWEEVKRKGLDIIIALDTSKSMLAEDMKPNRLERSKLAIKDLVRELKGDRIGLIAFSGTAFLQCPLTVDYNGFLLSLDHLDAGTIPRGGTSISSAIKEAMKSYEGEEGQYKVLIITTDGEDHEGNPVKTAEEAKRKGIKIFCVGVGSKSGELIPITDKKGKFGFVKDRSGNVVKTRLDENTLKTIALTTGGSYVHATPTEFGLDFIYRKKLSKIEKRDIETKMKKYYEERFQVPLGIAFLLFAIVPFISDKKRKK